VNVDERYDSRICSCDPTRQPECNDNWTCKAALRPKWLEYGLIDLPFVNEQVKRYESGDDDNIEHYRYAAFRKLLEGAGSIDDLTLDRYVELAELDEDQEMAEAALGLLLRHNGLTEQQLESNQNPSNIRHKAAPKHH